MVKANRKISQKPKAKKQNSIAAFAKTTSSSEGVVFLCLRRIRIFIALL